MQGRYDDVYREDILAIPVLATGIFRFLQHRLSASSRYVRETAFQRSSNTTKSTQQFEMEAQAASNYSYSTVQNSPLEYELYKSKALTLATYLLPE